MAKSSRRPNQVKGRSPSLAGPAKSNAESASLPEQLPTTYQELHNEVERRKGGIDTFAWRREIFLRIEAITDIPLIAYVARTVNYGGNAPVAIDNSDLSGFSDLVRTTPGDKVDVVLMSNGGSAEATERIVNLLRGQYQAVRFILPANAYSAATLMCMSGDAIIMDGAATLGPIDPQLGGIPARAILRSFERVKNVLAEEGPKSLTAYMPLLSKYDLHTLEICRSAEELSAELAAKWLSQYMLKCSIDDEKIVEIVRFFGDYDLHKSHARSIDRATASRLGLEVHNTEDTEGLDPLVRSLHNLYEFFFDKTSFIKLFENARGINWGRQASRSPLS